MPSARPASRQLPQVCCRTRPLRRRNAFQSNPGTPHPFSSLAQTDPVGNVTSQVIQMKSPWARIRDYPKSSPKLLRKILSMSDASLGESFSAQHLKFLAQNPGNRRNSLSNKHFLHSASYSALLALRLAAGL